MAVFRVDSCDAEWLARLLQAAYSFGLFSKQSHPQKQTLWSNDSWSACLMDSHPNIMRALVSCTSSRLLSKPVKARMCKMHLAGSVAFVLV